MIDFHSHILHGLDDGAKNLQESIEMCLIGFKDGIRTVVATPHTLNGVYQNDRSTILAKVQELNKEIIKFGAQSSEFGVQETSSAFRIPHSAFSLTVLPGADVYFTEDLLNQLEKGNAITAGDCGKYILLEFPAQGIPYGVEEVLFQLMIKGITPIISHPERNFEITLNPQRYFEMIKMGCLGQVTAMSLTGGFGGEVKRVAEKFLKARLVHIIASDAHSQNSRPPILSSAVRAAARIVGEEEACKMVTEYPQAILNGQIPNIS
jgi:protein-tyrosine phosphatase